MLVLLLAQPAIVVRARAAQMSEAEKIDALLVDVETRSDLRFLRLGSVHSSHEAARMLRLKLRFAGSRIRTVDDFIQYIATATASGHPYFVLYPDGRRVASAEFLRGELRRLTRESNTARQEP